MPPVTWSAECSGVAENRAVKTKDRLDRRLDDIKHLPQGEKVRLFYIKREEIGCKFLIQVIICDLDAP